MRGPSLPTRVVWVWGIFLLGLVIYSFVWFINMSWFFTVFEVLESVNPNLGELGNAVVDLIKTLIVYHPIFALFGYIIWGFIHSTRRDSWSYETEY